MKLRVGYKWHGFSKIIIIGIAVVVIAAGLIGWLIFKNNGSTPTNSATAANSACLKVYNDRDYCKYTISSDLTGVSYKAVFTSTQGTAGSSTTMILLTDSKGNTSMSSTNGGVASDTITLKGTTYTKDPADGTWWKLPANNASTPTTTDPAGSIKLDTIGSSTTATPATTYKKLGTEACGNATCFKYQVVDTSTPSTTQYLWINTKTYQTQRWSSKDSTGASTDVVYTYQPITITAPKSAKDLTATTAAEAQALQQAQIKAGH